VAYRNLGEIFLDDDDLPAQNELLWNYVDRWEWDAPLFSEVTVNPGELIKWEVDGAGTTIMEAFKDWARPWQEKLVKKYRKQARELAKTCCLLVDLDGETLVDGHHRLIAMALEGVKKAKALDLSDEWDIEMGCARCGAESDDIWCDRCV
jgi:hypothetical protein